MKKFTTEIIIDDKYSEPKVVIYTNKRTEKIDNLISAINNLESNDIYVNAYDGNKLVLIKETDIIRIARIGRQVILETKDNKYVLKKTLIQLEEELDNSKFIRISQSEIINAYKVKSLNFSFTGTIIIEFNNGLQSNVSRRNVKYVKEFFEGKKEK